MPENLYSKVSFPSYIFFGGVEFRAFVHVMAACLASYAHGKHHAHFHGVVLGPFALGQLRRIEVRRKVLVQYLTFTHVVGYLGCAQTELKVAAEAGTEAVICQTCASSDRKQQLQRLILLQSGR